MVNRPRKRRGKAPEPAPPGPPGGTPAAPAPAPAPGARASVDIRNRVRELRTVRASSLLVNPRNYRRHPLAQREVMRGVLAELGCVDALLARETPAGLELVDGHMRREELGDTEVPVLVLDLSDDEVDKVLATLDPIGALAVNDDHVLRDLLARVETQNADVRRFLADTAHELEQDADEDAGDVEEEHAHDVPGMALEPHEHYDYLVVLCTTTHEWNVLCDKLGLEPVKRRGRMGTCRAIRAAQLFDLLARAAGG